MTDSNWNPMKMAHDDPHFNSYDEGPGKNFRAAVSGGTFARDNSRLFVRNIPQDVTVDGLSNILTAATGAAPENVRFAPRNEGYTTKAAFVVFSNSSEASKAIMTLHKRLPLNLDVTYQKSRDFKNGGQSRPNNFDTLARKTEESTSPVKQAHLPDPSGVIDWEGVTSYKDDAYIKDREWADPKGAFVEPRSGDFYNSHGGANGKMELVNRRDTGVGVNLNISAGSDGRRVSLGRGYIAPGQSTVAPGQSLLGAPPQSLLGAPPQSQKYLPSLLALPTLTPPIAAHHVPEGPSAMAAVAVLPCQKCMAPARMVCKLCAATRYCSAGCASAHWDAHKYTCSLLCAWPGIVPVSKDAVTAITSAMATVAVAAPTAVPAAVPAVVATAAIPAPANNAPPVQAANLTAGMDDYVDLPTDKYSVVVVSVAEGPTAWVTVESRGDRTYEMVAEISRRKDLAMVEAPRVGDRLAALFCSEWYRARVVKETPLTVFYVDYGHTEQIPVSNVRALPAEYARQPAQAVRIALPSIGAGSRRTLSENQELLVRAVRRIGELTYIAFEDSEPAAQVPPEAVLPAVLPETVLPAVLPAAELPAAELPAGVLTAVMVVGPAPTGGTWVNLAGNAGALAQLFAGLLAAFAQAPPPAAGTLVIGRLVAVSYLRAVYRARVTSVAGPVVSLHLVDEGRDVVVDAAKIRDLPDEFSTLEAQGIQIQVEEGIHLKLSELLEGTEIIVKPIRKAPCGATVVEVPCNMPKLPCQRQVQALSKVEATEVYFVNKDGDTKHIQTRQSSLVLTEMLKELKELGSMLEPVAPVVGSVVLLEFEGEWSRAKILSVQASIEVVFIDYGNEGTCAKEDIRQLPEKYTTLEGQCMKVFVTSDTPAGIRELDEYNVFKATLVGQTAEGALIIRGSL